MSTIDLVREISAELAVNTKSQSTGWRWARGVVPFPDIRCPYCKETVRSMAIWKHTETALIGAAQLVPGQTPVLDKVEHPHARQEWSGQKICFGSAKDAHQALFGALNPDYTEHTIPFLQRLGHECDAIEQEVPEEEGLWCTACETAVDAGDAYHWADDPYCADCFYEKAFYCDMCGGAFSRDEVFTDPEGDIDYCEGCFETKYFKCYYCRKAFNLDERTNDPDGDACCSDCFSDKFFECECCNEIYEQDKQADYKDERLCQECYDKDAVKCPVCKTDYNTNDEDATTEHTKETCDECKASYFPCEGEHTCG